jgi:hypothetical protein
MIILNVRFGRELDVITASLSTTAFGGTLASAADPQQSAKIIFKAKLSFKSRSKLHSLKQNFYESFICLCKLNIITSEQ